MTYDCKRITTSLLQRQPYSSMVSHVFNSSIENVVSKKRVTSRIEADQSTRIRDILNEPFRLYPQMC